MIMKKLILAFTILSIPWIIKSQEGLSLSRCKELALENNRKIKIAEQEIDAAGSLKKAAFTQYFPDFSVNGAYKYFNKDFKLLKNDLFLPVVPYSAIDQTTGQLSETALSDPAVAASTFVINPYTGEIVTDGSGNYVFQQYTYLPASETGFNLGNLFIANAGFTQPVYLGGKIREANKIATQAQAIAENNLSLKENELIYNVEESYWRVVSLGEKVRLAEKYEEMLERLVKDLENIHEEGIITNNDLLKAKVKLNEAGIMLLKARNGMALSKMALCQITGIPYSEEVNLTDSLNTPANDIADLTVNEDRITERPELMILEKNISIASSNVNLMRSRYLPNIALNAGYYFINPNPYNGLEKEFGSDYSLSVVCNIPIFHFGDKKHTLSAAKNEKTIAEQEYEEAKEMLVLQLNQAVYSYTEAENKKLYSEKALEQASGNLSFVEDNFREGLLKTSDLLEAQVMWQKAYSEYIDASADRKMAACNLKKVTGKY